MSITPRSGSPDENGPQLYEPDNRTVAWSAPRRAEAAVTLSPAVAYAATGDRTQTTVASTAAIRARDIAQRNHGRALLAMAGTCHALAGHTARVKLSTRGRGRRFQCGGCAAPQQAREHRAGCPNGHPLASA